MEIVTDSTIVKVGKTYLVRCAAMRDGDYECSIYGYVPVIGELHRDPQISKAADWPHYHIDARFLTIKAADKLHLDIDRFGSSSNIVYKGHRNIYYAFFDEIVLQPLKCVRLTTGINPPESAVQYYKWYDSMKGKSCAGGKCPHLGTTMHLRNGKLVCPLHNLNGCPEREIII